MAVSTRQGLIDYALRALGEPVVEINVDPGQLEDRVDEALEFFRLYHYDGIEKLYMKFAITASEMVIGTSNAGDFSLGETVTGSISGATAVITREVERESADSLILVKNVEGTFQNGETVTGAE